MGTLSLRTIRPYDYPDNWKIIIRRKKIKKLINEIRST